MLFLLYSTSLAATLTVGGAGEDFSSLQSAVSAASDGDTLLVSAGTYSECVSLEGKDLTITGAEGSGLTVLDGEGLCENALEIALGETAHIEGLTILNSGQRGLYVEGATVSAADLSVLDAGNTEIDGGGVYVAYGTLSIEDCLLSGNTGRYGGNAFAEQDGVLSLARCEVSDGYAQHYGGGVSSIFNFDGPDDPETEVTAALYLDTVELTNNSGVSGGGAFVGMYVAFTSSNCTWTGNTARASSGGAIYAVQESSSVRIAGDTFTGNYAEDHGGAVKIMQVTDMETEGRYSIQGARFSENSSQEGGALMIITDVVVSETEFTSNEASLSGGAIYVKWRYGSLDLSDSSFSDNVALDPTSTYGGGGAIYQESNRDLSISGTTFEGNTAAQYGGAILLVGFGSVAITDSAFSSNVAEAGRGGALSYVGDGDEPEIRDHVTMSGVTFDGNTAYDNGGALYVRNLYGTLAVSDFTAVDNGSTTGGGGAFFVAEGSDLDLADGAFTGNTADSGGGAVYWRDGGSVQVEDVTFTSNTSTSAKGGALFLTGSMSKMETCCETTLAGLSFEDNQSSNSGGALYVYELGGALALSESSFVRNAGGTSSRSAGGGAVYIADNNNHDMNGNTFCGNTSNNGAAVYSVRLDTTTAASASWTNNVLVENSASYSGGAFYLADASGVVLTNNTLVGNDATTGGGLYLDGATVDFANNIIAWTSSGDGATAADSSSDSGSAFTYNDWYENTSADVSGALTFSTSSDGNLTEDPGFVDYSLDGDCDNDDLSLSGSSALLDAGDPDVADTDGSTSDIGSTGGPRALLVDRDGDGVAASDDCDDTDASISPDADERCDGIDNDCDGSVDGADATDASTWYADTDADGYGGSASSAVSCTMPDGYVADGTDCDDADALTSPEGVESCDDVDNDCDGSADESGATGELVWYADQDEDGYGDAERTTMACDLPDGYAVDSNDCDDSDGAIYPGASESAYDGIDQDCSGADLTDVDADGHDSVAVDGDDCDDEDPGVHPGATDTPGDGVDQDCSGLDAGGDNGDTGETGQTDTDETGLATDTGPPTESAAQDTAAEAPKGEGCSGCGAGGARSALAGVTVTLLAALGRRRSPRRRALRP